MRQKRQASVSGSLTVVAILSGTILASTNIYADDVIDEVNITVPVSCSLEGTGMNSHNANIVNGTVNSAIGETTMKAFCNDNEGFAIYAIGYTDNTDGKNVLTSSALGSTHDIATSTATSGANSNWAMKLSTVTSPTPTYPITIQNSFDSFHAVPNDYTLVAKRTSATDVGQNAEGSTIKSTITHKLNTHRVTIYSISLCAGNKLIHFIHIIMYPIILISWVTINVGTSPLAFHYGNSVVNIQTIIYHH